MSPTSPQSIPDPRTSTGTGPREARERAEEKARKFGARYGIAPGMLGIALAATNPGLSVADAGDIEKVLDEFLGGLNKDASKLLRKMKKQADRAAKVRAANREERKRRKKGRGVELVSEVSDLEYLQVLKNEGRVAERIMYAGNDVTVRTWRDGDFVIAVIETPGGTHVGAAKRNAREDAFDLDLGRRRAIARAARGAAKPTVHVRPQPEVVEGQVVSDSYRAKIEVVEPSPDGRLEGSKVRVTPVKPPVKEIK